MITVSEAVPEGRPGAQTADRPDDPSDLPAEHLVRDQTDVIVEQWRQEDPEMDVSSKSAALRLRRLANHLERELRRELLPLEMEAWEFEVLLSLRRAPEHRLSAGALLRYCQVTSGAISNRLARLEARGWVRRDIDPRDRRQVLVTLTEDGVARAQQLIATKTVAEQRILSRLDRATLERVNGDLRALLVSIEGPAGDFRAGEILICPSQPPLPSEPSR